MSLLKKKYELVNPDEKPIDTDVYFRKAKEEYTSILSCDYQEKVYQKFFRKLQVQVGHPAVEKRVPS